MAKEGRFLPFCPKARSGSAVFENETRCPVDFSEMKIGERFQEETKYFRPSALHRRTEKEPALSSPRGIPLPEAKFLTGPNIWEIMGNRRSVRDYSPDPIPLQDLSNLLWATQGITEKAPGPWFRTAPSAGALHPMDTYIVAARVGELGPGIYRLRVEDFSLEPKKLGNFASLISQAALDQEIVRNAAVVFVWVAVIQRSRQKYRQRAYRYIYLDSGHIAQNLYLAATALNLGCCAVAAFFDEEVNQLLGVDGKEETALYLATVGKRGRAGNESEQPERHFGSAGIR
jgi:SagB-type dehydrogenase family enzyme